MIKQLDLSLPERINMYFSSINWWYRCVYLYVLRRMGVSFQRDGLDCEKRAFLEGKIKSSILEILNLRCLIDI